MLLFTNFVIVEHEMFYITDTKCCSIGVASDKTNTTEETLKIKMFTRGFYRILELKICSTYWFESQCVNKVNEIESVGGTQLVVTKTQ